MYNLVLNFTCKLCVKFSTRFYCNYITFYYLKNVGCRKFIASIFTKTYILCIDSFNLFKEEMLYKFYENILTYISINTGFFNSFFFAFAKLIESLSLPSKFVKKCRRRGRKKMKFYKYQ